MKLVLFDLDNTLLNGDSDFAWAQFLIAKGVLDREVQEARNLAFYEQYKAGTLDIFEFLDFQLAPLARHPREQLDAWHEAYMQRKIRPIIRERAVALIESHADALRAIDAVERAAEIVRRHVEPDAAVTPAAAELAVRFRTAKSEEALAGLLSALVSAGLAVTQFREVQTDLEEAFLTVARE